MVSKVYPNAGQYLESHWKYVPPVLTLDSKEKKEMSNIVIHAMLQNLIIHTHDGHY